MDKEIIHEPYRRLKGRLKEMGLSYKNVANILEITEVSVSNKINGKSDFYLSEVSKINKLLGIKHNIFFDK